MLSPRAFLLMVYSSDGDSSRTYDGATLFGWFAAETVGGLRPGPGKPGGVGRAVLCEPWLGLEDFLCKEAYRSDREGELSSWSQAPGSVRRSPPHHNAGEADFSG